MKGSDRDVHGLADTNVLGLITLTQSLVNYFKAQKKGHIINLGSIGELPRSGFAKYELLTVASSQLERVCLH